MHTIEKSAEIYCRILSLGQPIRQTISDQGLIDVAAAYGQTLNKDLLK
jgi:rhamnulose-1-phosphate aldolase